MALDVINTRIYIPPEPKVKRKPPKYQIKIPFTSKAMDFVNLPKILRNEKVVEAGNGLINDDEVPMTVFQLSQPIRLTILNYSKFVSTLDLIAFQNNPGSIPCACSSFDNKFCDPNHKHIITGDLNIIQNAKLRDLIGKGPNFREPQKVDFEAAQAIIVEGLDGFIKMFSKIKKVSEASFIPWRNEIITRVENKIHFAKRSCTFSDPKSVFDDQVAKKELKSLHNNFIFVPIDKASNNVAIICKHYYASTILKELNVTNNNVIDSTYEVSIESEGAIIDRHVKFQDRLNINVKEEFRHLPKHYWTPKMHKQVVSERFITASVMSSLKPLAQDVTKIFQCIYNFTRAYYRAKEFHSGLKYFWVIDNNTEFCKALDRINARKRAKSIATFDFSTLYTKIPHDQLIECLTFFIDLVFNKKDRKYLSVTSSGANWVSNRKSSGTVYDIDNVKESLEFLISNSYFHVGTQVYRQKIGIPMGLDPAPFLANLYLSYYEIHWVDSLRRIDFARAKKYVNNYRFIDDLSALNDGGEFERSHKSIYPKELTLKKENEGMSDATFLDMETHIKDDIFDYHLFDKRDGFNFFIVRFPYACSNIPNKIFVSTIGAEILRISRASSSFQHFVNFCSPFFKRMCKQGASISEIKSVFLKFFKRHETIFVKFQLPFNEMVAKLKF